MEFNKKTFNDFSNKRVGGPDPNAVKFFSAVELILLLTDREWLVDATKTIEQFWEKNAKRNGLDLRDPNFLKRIC